MNISRAFMRSWHIGIGTGLLFCSRASDYMLTFSKSLIDIMTMWIAISQLPGAPWGKYVKCYAVSFMTTFIGVWIFFIEVLKRPLMAIICHILVCYHSFLHNSVSQDKVSSILFWANFWLIWLCQKMSLHDHHLSLSVLLSVDEDQERVWARIGYGWLIRCPEIGWVGIWDEQGSRRFCYMTPSPHPCMPLPGQISQW